MQKIEAASFGSTKRRKRVWRNRMRRRGRTEGFALSLYSAVFLMILQRNLGSTSNPSVSRYMAVPASFLACITVYSAAKLTFIISAACRNPQLDQVNITQTDMVRAGPPLCQQDPALSSLFIQDTPDGSRPCAPAPRPDISSIRISPFRDSGPGSCRSRGQRPRVSHPRNLR